MLPLKAIVFIPVIYLRRFRTTVRMSNCSDETLHSFLEILNVPHLLQVPEFLVRIFLTKTELG